MRLLIQAGTIFITTDFEKKKQDPELIIQEVLFSEKKKKEINHEHNFIKVDNMHFLLMRQQMVILHPITEYW